MRSFVLIALAVAIGSTSPAVAQSSNIEGRVGRLEKEMKAVQRKVFPGGGSQYFEPQIAPAPATPTPAPGTPASSPVADLMARVNALESQLATLTGQTEQNAFKLRQLEEAFNKYKGDMEARATSSAAPPPVTSTVGPGKTTPPPDEGRKAAIGRAHVRTPVTNAQLVCRLHLEK